MRVLIKCLTGQIDAVDVAVSGSGFADITADIFQKAGSTAQTCLYFEDRLLADGSNLSDHVIKLCQGTILDDEERSGVSNVEDVASRSATVSFSGSSDVSPDVASRSATVSFSGSSDVSPSSSQDGPVFADPGHAADAPASPCNTSGDLHGPLWMVAGGFPEGGILVREGPSLKSALIEERLSTGAHIQQIELRGQRLRFRRLTGMGPQTGWISIEVLGKILAERVDKLPSQLHQAQEELLRTAFFFPGEGVQYVNMVRTSQHMPAVKEMFDKARAILGYDLLDLMLSGPEVRLSQTTCAQPAIFVASLAALEKLKRQRPEAVARAFITAGFGLGHYTALCAAGVMSFEDGLKIVKARADGMEEALRMEKQLLILISGLNEMRLRQLCIQAAREEGPHAICQTAHHVFPKGYTVGGTERAAL